MKHPDLLLTRGSSIGFAGCGIAHKIEAVCGIREISRSGYGMKISWRHREALISIGGLHSPEIVSAIRDLNSK